MQGCISTLAEPGSNQCLLIPWLLFCVLRQKRVVGQLMCGVVGTYVLVAAPRCLH